MRVTDWPAAESIDTTRLVLEPLRVAHADEMARALDDPELHRFTGGAPATAEQLRLRYERLVTERSGDGTEAWLNWLARDRLSGATVGTVQATVTTRDGRLVAELAWVIASKHQRQGYAREAAEGMASWLRSNGAQMFVAHVHPEHRASIAVARHLGLAPTTIVLEGEIRWERDVSSDDAPM